MARYGLYSALLTLEAGAVNLRQLVSGEVSHNPQVADIVPAGALDRGAVVMGSAAPSAMLTTNDLLTLLTNFPLTTGGKCTSGAVFRGQKRDVATGSGNGTFTSGSTHRSWTSTLGWAGISRISCQQNQAAEATLQYVALYDGTNDPLVEAGSVGLGGSAPTFISCYFLGPVYLDGSVLPGVVGIDYSPGLQYTPIVDSGDLYPRQGSLRLRMPTLTVQVDDPEIVDAVSADRLNAGVNLAFYLRKAKTDDAGRYADDQGQHVKISFTACAIEVGGKSVSGADDWKTSIVVRPTAAPATSLTSAVP